MYTEEALAAAAQAGIFSHESVENLRRRVAGLPPLAVVHEERIRMVSGLNDVLVALASLLLLLVLYWMGARLALWCGGVLMAVAAWGMAEVFTRRRQMALSSIVLMLAFSAGGHAFGNSLVSLMATQPPLLGESDTLLGYCLAALAGYAHWCRFKTPVAVAVTAACLLALLHALLLLIAPFNEILQVVTMLIALLLTFALAVYWDSRDRYRLSWHSDVAFWLYLLPATVCTPVVLKAFFVLIESGATLWHAGMLFLLYGVLALVSLWTDRRALLIWPLLSVPVICYELIVLRGASLNLYSLHYGLAPLLLLSALLLALLLLLLAAFWPSCRAAALYLLPRVAKAYLPAQR